VLPVTEGAAADIGACVAVRRQRLAAPALAGSGKAGSAHPGGTL